MSKIEKKALDWIEEHIQLCILVVFLLLSIVIRYVIRNGISGDYEYFLLPWYEEIKAMDNKTALQTQVGNYNMLYQFIITILTHFPINPLYAYKMVSVIFDYVLAFAGAGLAGRVLSSKENKKCKWVWCVIICAPSVFLNSAYWGQCDSIYVSFVLLGLLMFMREKYSVSFFWMGIAMGFKLQTIFVMPVLLLLYLAKKKFSVLQFLLIPFGMVVCGLPNIIVGGRKISDVFTIYIEQADTYHSLAMNYPSFWVLLTREINEEIYGIIRNMTILFTVIVMSGLCAVWLLGKIKWTKAHILYAAFLLSYTCVFFLPSMHDRYAYLIEVLAIVIAFLIPKTLGLMFGLQILSLQTYGAFLFKNQINLTILAGINCCIYFFYAWILTNKMKNDSI